MSAGDGCEVELFLNPWTRKCLQWHEIESYGCDSDSEG